MNFNFISGFLLSAVTLGIVAYVIKEIFADQTSDFWKFPRLLADALTRRAGSEGKPVNAHLIASSGKVIAHSADDSRPMNVRVGVEHWAARLNSSDAAPLPVGTPVKVTAVDGHVLIVEATVDDSALAQTEAP
jgi:membrane-bound ClpP family serine protease